MKNNQSFTLIELLVVIAIIGILAGILIISMTSATNSANDARRKADLNQLVSAIQMIKIQDGTLPTEANYNCKLGSTNNSENCSGIQAKLVAQGITIPRDPVSGNYYIYNRISNDDFAINSTMSNQAPYTYTSSDSTYTATPMSSCRSTTDISCEETVSGSYIINKYTLINNLVTASTIWTPPAGVSEIEYLVVAGGGSGDGYFPGGGGGGGVLTNVGSAKMSVGTDLNITVGKGGKNSGGGNSILSNGTTTKTAIGGGRGSDGVWNGVKRNATTGGSGGGGFSEYYGYSNGAAGTAGQGYAGGNGATCVGGYSSAGGGGAGGAGGSANCSSKIPGNGGPGILSTITGLYYGGGGGGAFLVHSVDAAEDFAAQSSGGIGGGGKGRKGSETYSWTAFPCTGGTSGLGGGGGGGDGYEADCAGGSGTVIIRFLKP